tara:strand:+ start:12901 stop:13074 length:174 start_codon:yes stop_codon:yes gene_type:complete
MKNIQNNLVPVVALILALGISGSALADRYEDPEATIIVVEPTLETSTNQAVLFEVCI